MHIFRMPIWPPPVTGGSRKDEVNCMYLLSKEHNWFPYYGSQARLVNFVLEAIVGLFPAGKKIRFAETNAGSHAVAFNVGLWGHKVLANDVSPFSDAIGRSLAGKTTDWPTLEPQGGSGTPWLDELVREVRDSVDVAAVGAALLEVGGYELKLPDNQEALRASRRKWREWLLQHRDAGVRFESLTRLDVFDFLKGLESNVDVVYMDFAWPWRDGRGTEEYTEMVDLLGSWAVQKPTSFEPWTSEDILENVRHAVELARISSRFVILSNQSSNYPTDDVLQKFVEDQEWPLVAKRTLTVPALDVDNRGLDPMWTEYQYIIKGRE